MEALPCGLGGGYVLLIPTSAITPQPCNGALPCCGLTWRIITIIAGFVVRGTCSGMALQWGLGNVPWRWGGWGAAIAEQMCPLAL